MATAESIMARLEMQGYAGFGGRALRDIEFGLRFVPPVSAIGTAVGTANRHYEEGCEDGRSNSWRCSG